jgi:hypothetical protein
MENRHYIVNSNLALRPVLRSLDEGGSLGVGGDVEKYLAEHGMESGIKN